MAESFVNVTEGSGKKLHTNSRTVGANTVEDEVVVHGEQYLATYYVSSGSVSAATLDAHLLQIMAGASLNVYIRRIWIWQTVAITTAAMTAWQLRRLTTAGTGGGTITPAPYELTDGASGATAMTLPTVKGSEGAFVLSGRALPIQTIPTSGQGQGLLLADINLDINLRSKTIRIPAGTANGVALKWQSASTGLSVEVAALISEATF